MFSNLTWPIIKNVPCELEKNVYHIVRWNVLYVSVKLNIDFTQRYKSNLVEK